MKNKSIIFKLLYLILLFSSINIFSQSVKVKNVKFESSGEFIRINYDLEGDANEKFIIECFLKSESDKDFAYQLKYTSGDIGEGKFVGREREIIWNYQKEFPQKLSGDDFYFEVSVDKKSSGIAWYYYVGAAVLGGSTAYLLLSGNTTDSQTPTYANFPLHP